MDSTETHSILLADTAEADLETKVKDWIKTELVKVDSANEPHPYLLVELPLQSKIKDKKLRDWISAALKAAHLDWKVERVAKASTLPGNAYVCTLNTLELHDILCL